jgi:hypothetical protein
MLKRQTVILPFNLPPLNDKAAAQLIDLLHQLVEGIEYHYAVQIHRYHKRLREIQQTRLSSTTKPTDPPF